MLGTPGQPERRVSPGGTLTGQKQTVSGGHGKQTRGCCRAGVGLAVTHPPLRCPRCAGSGHGRPSRGQGGGKGPGAARRRGTRLQREPARPRSRALSASGFSDSDLCCCTRLLALQKGTTNSTQGLDGRD